MDEYYRQFYRFNLKIAKCEPKTAYLLNVGPESQNLNNLKFNHLFP